MTIEELEAMDSNCITPAVASAFLNCSRYLLCLAARDCPEKLPFPVYRSGCRTKIPRRAFISWAKGERGR